MYLIAPPVLTPGSALEMEPGGIHVMLSRLPRSYSIGDTLRLVLSFAASGELVVPVQVRPLGARW